MDTSHRGRGRSGRIHATYITDKKLTSFNPPLFSREGVHLKGKGGEFSSQLPANFEPSNVQMDARSGRIHATTQS